MADIAFFLKHLKPDISRRHVSFQELSHVQGIIILDREMPLKSGYIYIGEANANAKWLRTCTFTEPTTLFLTGDTYLVDPLFKNDQLNIITVETGLLTLYNQLNRILMNYNSWSFSLVNQLCQGHDLSTIVNTAADLMKGYIFLLNPGFKVLSCGQTRYFEDSFAEELLSQGYMAYQSVEKINQAMHNCTVFSGSVYRSEAAENGNRYYIKYIQVNNQLIGILLFIVNETHQYMDVIEMIESLGNIVNNLLIQTVDFSLTSNNVFRTLLADFAENKLISNVEINNRFSLLPYPPQKYVYCVIVDCPQTDMPYEFLINKLENILPQANITVWNHQIVVMHSCNEQAKHLENLFDMDALNNLLEPFNGHAIISRATSHYEMFKTLYQLSHRMLEILMKMHMLSEYGRIYHYSDYTIYLAIDFCAQYYQNYTGHSDIIYLADPAIIRLTRYDTEHKTELRDVLFYHLLNGRNVAKTAKIMYMHRNTILNKLNKINQLIELPLEDGRTQQQLLFSCQIVKYYTEYLCLELT